MTRARDRHGGSGTWYRIENSAPGPAQVLIYSEIGFFGVTAADFIRDLDGISGPVDVHINSPGGDVFDAWAMYNALVSRPGVTTVVDSLAASAASVVVMAGERRLMARTSQLMIHDAWSGTDGDAADMRKLADRLDTVSGQIAGVYADTAGGTVEHWRGLMRAETYFTPEQALEAGLITGVTGPTRDPAPAAPATGSLPAEVSVTPMPVITAQAQPQAASVDTSPWDGNAAMSSCSSASDYRSICAGEKTVGSPDERQHWALPHHKSPGAAPNAGGVRNALSRLPQTQDLKNKQAAQSHLDAHMKAVNPGDSATAPPPRATTSTEPHTRPGERSATEKGKVMDDRMTVEERVARQSEIRARLTEIDAEYSGAELKQEARAEWNDLQNELVVNERAIADANQRAEYLRYINDMNPGAAEGVDGATAGYGQHTTMVPDPPRFGGNGSGFGNGGRSPAFHAHRDIYDLAAIRNRARHIDEVPHLYKEYAIRAVEQARFPGATGRNGAPNREGAQERIAALLDTIDDEQGTLARRILVTGSPLYDRAFGKVIARQSTMGLTAEEIRALSLGTDSAGGFAVPFQLDPTILLTSNGAVNPLRQIARVETITGKEWDGVTSAGVTVSRAAEATEASDGSPTLAQPTVRTTRVQGFVPFSIELDVTWNNLRQQMTSLLMDAKDVEEATSFVTGNGTAPNASGIVATLSTASRVTTIGSAALAIDDLYALENAMAPRYRQQAAYLASRTYFNRFRRLFQAVAAMTGDRWTLPSDNPMPRGTRGAGDLNGYPAYESSAMVAGTVVATNDLAILQGDFSQFLIVDRVGMGIELIPHLFGSANRFPTGQRGIYALWFNNSKVLVDNAFRLLRVGP